MLGIRIKREKKIGYQTFDYSIFFNISRKYFPSKVLLDSFYYMAPNKQRNPCVCCARTKVSNERVTGYIKRKRLNKSQLCVVIIITSP